MNSVFIFCQSAPNTPMNVGEPWATIGRTANYAGQHSNMAHYLPTLNRADVNWAWSGGGYCRRNHGNPYAEKEARLRPQHFTFGSGETRKHMRETLGRIKGLSRVLRHLAPNTFMKYLMLLIVGASVSYGQSFNGTVFDLDSGRTQVISGSMGEDDSIAAMRQRTIERYRRMNAELEASIAASRQEYELQQQTRELREQTRLLRQLVNE